MKRVNEMPQWARKLSQGQRSKIKASCVVFAGISGGNSTVYCWTLAEVRAWHQEANGARLRRFIASGGRIRRVK